MNRFRALIVCGWVTMLYTSETLVPNSPGYMNATDPPANEKHARVFDTSYCCNTAGGKNKAECLKAPRYHRATC